MQYQYPKRRVFHTVYLTTLGIYQVIQLIKITFIPSYLVFHNTQIGPLKSFFAKLHNFYEYLVVRFQLQHDQYAPVVIPKLEPFQLTFLI